MPDEVWRGEIWHWDDEPKKSENQLRWARESKLEIAREIAQETSGTGLIWEGGTEGLLPDEP
jgi:hypothetical protein